MRKNGLKFGVRGLKLALASWQAGAVIVGLSLLAGLGLFWSYSLHVQSADDFGSERYLQAVSQLIYTTQNSPGSLTEIEPKIQNTEKQGKALKKRHPSMVAQTESIWKAWLTEWRQNQKVSATASQRLLFSVLEQNFAIRKAEETNNIFRLNILWMGLSVLLIPAAYGLRLLAKLKQVEQHLEQSHQVASDRHSELEAQQEMLLANEEELERTATRLMTSNELLIQVSRRFETLFHGLPIACLAFDTELTVHEWNPAFETAFDFMTPTLFHANVLAILEQRSCVGLGEHELREVLRGETLEGVESEITLKNGHKKQFLSSLFPMRNEKSEVIAAICAFLDISSRKKMEVEIKASNEHYEFALESSNTSLFELNMESKELSLSKGFERLLDYNEGEFEKTYENFLTHIHPEDLPSVESQLKNHFEEQEPYDIMFRLRTKNGNYKWFQSIGIVKTSSSHQEHFLGIVTEITNLKEAEIAAKRNHERFDLAVKGSSDGIWDMDILQNEVYYSPRWKEILGYKDHEIQEHFDEFSSRLHPDDAEHVLETIKDYLDRRIDKYEFEFRMRHKDGSYRWILTRGLALWDNQGKAYRMSGSHTDITEQKRSEEQLKIVLDLLKISEERINETIQGSKEGLWDIDTENWQLICSPIFSEMLGFDKKGLFHNLEEFFDVILPEDREIVKQKILSSSNKRNTLDVEFRTQYKRGNYSWFRIYGEPCCDPNQNTHRIAGTLTDITQKKLSKLAI